MTGARVLYPKTVLYKLMNSQALSFHFLAFLKVLINFSFEFLQFTFILLAGTVVVKTNLFSTRLIFKRNLYIFLSIQIAQSNLN